jgi:hypothetical protein
MISFRSGALLCVIAALAGCEDGTIGQRGSPAWYAQSTLEQKQIYYRDMCSGRYGLNDGKEMNTCIQDLNTSFAIYNGKILLCPLTKTQEKNGRSCQSTIPKYGPDFLF